MKKPVRKKKLYVADFSSYILKVLKLVHPDIHISTNSKSQVNSLINVLGNAIAIKANELNNLTSKKTISSKDIQTAVRLLVPGELAKHADSEGARAVRKYNERKKGKRKKVMGAVKAGIIFPPSRGRDIIESHTRKRISAGASVYLVAVLEYMTAEILELSGNAARDNKLKTIKTRNILLAIENDTELNDLILELNWEVLGGGVLPNIHAKIIPKKKNKFK